ncbi:lipocalin-like domain-containing protein [Phocaeicola faecalis]
MRNRCGLKFLSGVVAAVLLCLVMGGCQKEAIDSDMEGHWELVEYTTAADGKVHVCNRIYYSIQLWVVEIAAKQSGTPHKPVIGRFEHEENGNVRMRDFKGRKATSDDKKDVTTEFEVVKANGKELILKSDYATLMLKRF